MDDLALIERTFSNIYLNNLWKKGSGPGSAPKATQDYRNFLIDTIKKTESKIILDYGCGDWQFSKLINWNNIVDKYYGVDIVDSVILENKQKYSNSNVTFETVNDQWQWPIVDLIVCKDVLQHLPNAFVADLLQKMSVCSKYLLVTNDVYDKLIETNTDCQIGKSRPLDFSYSPWSLNIIETKTYQQIRGRIKQSILVKNI